MTPARVPVSAAVGETSLFTRPDSQPEPTLRPARIAEPRVRAELFLPEDVVDRARALTRPHRTGARRSLGASIVLAAMIRAMDSLSLTVDMQGIDRGADDELAKRFGDALRAWRDDDQREGDAI